MSPPPARAAGALASAWIHDWNGPASGDWPALVDETWWLCPELGPPSLDDEARLRAVGVAALRLPRRRPRPRSAEVQPAPRGAPSTVGPGVPPGAAEAARLPREAAETASEPTATA